MAPELWVYPLSLLGDGYVQRYRCNAYTRNKKELLETLFSMPSVSYQRKLNLT
jgi:hypothetical protein